MRLWGTFVRKTSVGRGTQSNQPARAGCAHDEPPAKSFAADRAAARGAGNGVGAAARSGGPQTGMNTELLRLAAACNAAADHYCNKPEQANVATVIDLYRALASLAEILAMQPTQERLH
jgi:hypothetical protein